MDTPVFSLRYKTALELVAVLFREKNRDLGTLPYIVHLAGVSRIVSQATDDEDVLIAALLHDVLEDIEPEVYDETTMRQDFGSRVTDIVKTVSHDEGKYGKRKSRELYLEQIKNGSPEACLVSAADLLHNAQDIVYLYEKIPDTVLQKFGGGRAERRRWFWGERYRILNERLGSDNVLIKELQPILARLEEIHAEIL